MWKRLGTNNVSRNLLLMQRRRQKIILGSNCSCYHRPSSLLISNSNNDNNQSQGQHQQFAKILMKPPNSFHNILLVPKQQQQQRRYFSDNLLGHSPMAKPSPTIASSSTNDDNNNNTDSTNQKPRIPTTSETTIGGVWAPTSAKRDKLAELKGALEEDQNTLDDAATFDQKQDLYLVDGLKLICKISDSVTAGDVDNSPSKEIEELSEFLLQQQQEITTQKATAEGGGGEGTENTILNSDLIDKAELELVVGKIVDKIDMLLTHYPPGRCLRQVCDFYDPDEIPNDELTKFVEDTAEANNNNDLNKNFDGAVIRFRLLLAKAAAIQIQDSWTILTTNSDGDVDRAAINGQSLESEVSVISIAQVFKYIFVNAAGTCKERLDATWELLDRDNDGLLDQSEMNSVAFLTLGPVQSAIQTIFEESLDNIVDVDNSTENEGKGDVETGPEQATAATPPPPHPPKAKGWRQRRKDAKKKKSMMKMISNSCKNHFVDEVEIDHRLRCIYAWAEKQHQNNKIDSVLVEEDGSGGTGGAGGGGSSSSILTGRKRHVELAPKISLEEFREVQKEHCTHIDRIGEEILKSFREDLWVQQGKGRQNRELIRDCAAFLAVVSLVDYIILSL